MGKLRNSIELNSFDAYEGLVETSSTPEFNDISSVPPNTPKPILDESKTVADSSTEAYAEPGAVIVISRVIFNYIVIAVVFFALGAVISGVTVGGLFNANSAENTTLINTAAQAFSAQNAALINSAVQAGASGSQQAAGLIQGNSYQVSADDDPFRGAADAPVTIVEFSDFHCGFCGKFAAETLEPLLQNYDGKVRLVYRDYPFQTQGSLTAALAGQCMNDQGKFWEFHDLTFKNQQALTREQFITYAQQLNIDVATFTTCLDTQQHLPEVSKDVTEAQALGVNGTPAFFVNGRFISGAQAYSVFAAYIDEELGKLAESPVTPS